MAGHIGPLVKSVSQYRSFMKTRTILLTLVVCFLAVAVSFGANPNMGKWKLNEAKSKIPAGAPKNDVVTYEAAGDSVKVTVDGTDAAGKPAHNEWTGKFDGKDYPLTGDPNADTRSYKLVDEHSTELINKKAGKVTMTGHIVIAADGKTRSITVSGTDPDGKKVEYTAVYDKQ
jgi:hypothetical protein